MKTIFTGKNCIRLEKTDSTNTYLSGLAGSGDIPEGTLVLAHSQEQGRGQRGSAWESEPGKNLIFSLLLKPGFLRPEDQFFLNMAVSLGTSDFVQGCTGTDAAVKIKWPNDIYIGDKKAAGILIENTVSENIINQSVVGIGINMNQEIFPSRLPNPTSLKMASGKDFDLDEAVPMVCSCLEKRYFQLRTEMNRGISRREEPRISKDYLGRLYRLNLWNLYRFQQEEMIAMIKGVSETGKLKLENQDGKNLEADFKEIEFIFP